VETLGAQKISIATPVATESAADRIRARQFDFICPTIMVETEGHPQPYGDAGGDTPERLRSIMIAHQAA
jgi:predicted phosphoribosyltransferase